MYYPPRICRFLATYFREQEFQDIIDPNALDKMANALEYETLCDIPCDSTKRDDIIDLVREYWPIATTESVLARKQIRVTFRIPTHNKELWETPHRGETRLTELLQNFLDAIPGGDQVWNVQAEKLWSEEGLISVSASIEDGDSCY